MSRLERRDVREAATWAARRALGAPARPRPRASLARRAPAGARACARGPRARPALCRLREVAPTARPRRRMPAPPRSTRCAAGVPPPRPPRALDVPTRSSRLRPCLDGAATAGHVAEAAPRLLLAQARGSADEEPVEGTAESTLDGHPARRTGARAAPGPAWARVAALDGADSAAQHAEVVLRRAGRRSGRGCTRA